MFPRCCALFCLVASLAESQTQSVTGTVTSAMDSTPIAQASVTLSGNNLNQSVLTDQAGGFSFASVPPGFYNLLVQHPAYSTLAGVAQNVEAQKRPEPVRLRLTPYARLTGKITDENGYTFPSVNVSAIQRVVSNGKASLVVVSNAATNELGEFRMPQLKAGVYQVCANANASSYQRHHRLSYRTTCFPNTTDVSSAAWMSVGAGAEERLSFHLTPVAGIRVRGSVENAGKSLSLSLVSTDPHSFPSQQSEPVEWDEKTSTFRVLTLPSGDYSLTAQSNGPAGQIRSVRAIHAGTDDLNDVHLVMGEVSPLSGTVRLGDSALSAVNQIGVSWGVDQSLVIYALAGGTFDLPSPPPGEHEVYVRVAAGWIVQSIRQGGIEIEKVSVPETGTPEPIEVTLRQGGGSIEVSLPKGPAALTLLKRSSTRGEWLQQGETESVNNAGASVKLLKGIPPGEYSLFVWESANDIEYLNAEVLAKYEEFGQTVEVREGETTRVSAKVIPAH